MMTGSQILRDQVSAAATARLARDLAAPDRSNWLHQVAGTIRLALNRRIPVGFEDETGFHLGVQSPSEDDHMAWERAGMVTDDEQF